MTRFLLLFFTRPIRLIHLITPLLIFTITTSCKRNPLKVDISKIKEEIEIVRFEQELFNLSLEDTLTELSTLRNTHPDFFDLFTYKVINIGGINNEYFPSMITSFLTDSMIIELKHTIENKYSDFTKTEDALKKAFKYYTYHFPKKNLPTIYTMISGFNQSIVTAKGIIGISLDKYLGKDCPYYHSLSNIPQYKIKNMTPSKLISDVVYAWGLTEFPDNGTSTTLLDHIIHQGKLMYFTDALLPDMHDTLKIGYTQQQLQWCKHNEPQIWNFIIENRILYSNKRMDILRFTNDGPYTTGLPINSPPRTGIWIGWQIVRQYMKKHKKISLYELMNNTNYQKILNDSQYYPE